MKRSRTPHRIVFAVRGDTPAERARSLDRTSAACESTAANWNADPEAVAGQWLYVIVTNPRRSTSVLYGLRYARREIADGIGEAGGAISDGSHVQITCARPTSA